MTYELTVKTRVTRWSVTGVADEQLVRRHLTDVLTSEGLPFPPSLTDASFPAELAATGAYDEAVRDGRITVRRSARP